MNLSLESEEASFQREVRAWLKRNVPKRERSREPNEYGDPKRITELKAWQKKLFDAGYLAMGWPKEFGGQAEGTGDRRSLVMRQTILNEELLRAKAPSVIGGMGIQMVGPTIMQYGTDAQKRRYLPKILSAEEIW